MRYGPQHRSAEFTLKAGDYEAVVSPAFGGSIRALTFNSAPLLRNGPEEGGSIADGGCFPCVPYFGRTPRRMMFRSREIALETTCKDIDAELPIHGEAWLKPWTVAHQSGSEATIEFAHKAADGAWPWRFISRQHIAISDQGLDVRLSLRNVSGEEMLAGLGQHPYFNDAKGARLAFDANERWTQPLHGHSAALEPVTAGLGADAPSLLPDFLDHTFLGFTGDVEIEANNQKLRLSSDAPYLHIYRPKVGDFFCLEPTTHLPTMVSPDEQRHSLCVLRDQQEMSISTRISVVR